MENNEKIKTTSNPLVPQLTSKCARHEEKADIFGDHLNSVFKVELWDNDVITCFINAPCDMYSPIAVLAPEVKVETSKLNTRKAPGYDLI